MILGQLRIGARSTTYAALVCELWRLLNVHWRLQLSKKLKSAKNLSLNSEIWTSLPKLQKKKVLKTFVHFFQKSIPYVKPILECFNQGGLILPTFGSICRCYFPNLPQFVVVVDLRWPELKEYHGRSWFSNYQLWAFQVHQTICSLLNCFL